MASRSVLLSPFSLSPSLLLTVALLACGGRVQSEPPTAATFASALTSALCDHLEPCCAANALAFDHERCAGYVQTALDQMPTTHTFDATAAAACLSRVTSAAVACDSFWSTPITLCANVYSGGLPLGARCTTPFDCTAGPQGASVDCRVSGDSTSIAVCTVFDETVTPTECVGAGRTTYCTNDQSCDEGSGECRPRAALGSNCGSDQDCATGERCDVPSGSLAGTCAAGLAVGEDCSTDPGGCTPGTYCSEDDWTCTQALAPGAACYAPGVCGAGQCVEERCRSSGLAWPGTCGAQ